MTLDLAPIQARHQAATGGIWRYESYAGLGPHGVLGAANLPIGRLDFGEGDQADADRTFVLNAHADMTNLLAEVERLRELLDQRTGDIADKALENAALRARVGELLQDAATLAALYAAGVDNWDGYGDALSDLN